MVQKSLSQHKIIKKLHSAEEESLLMQYHLISNSNWIEWSTMQGVVVQVISKSDEHEADLILRARLLPELYDTKSNY